MFSYNHLITLFYIQSNAHFLTASAFGAIMKACTSYRQNCFEFLYVFKKVEENYVIQSK